jgi:hypothetical protein
MVQQSLIYSFVARGTVVLAEHTDFIGNFPEIALQCLQRLPATNTKFTYNTNGHTFNYLAHDGFSIFLSFYLFLLHNQNCGITYKCIVINNLVIDSNLKQ